MHCRLQRWRNGSPPRRQRRITSFPDAISMLDTGRIMWNAVLGARQVTDVYLLALAVEQGGRFVTLDHAALLKAVPGAKACHLEVI